MLCVLGIGSVDSCQCLPNLSVLYDFQQSLEKIIQRDFFPDVTKLHAQKDYLEAEENGDLGKMREISIKYGSSLAKSTPRSTAPCE